MFGQTSSDAANPISIVDWIYIKDANGNEYCVKGTHWITDAMWTTIYVKNSPVCSLFSPCYVGRAAHTYSAESMRKEEATYQEEQNEHAGADTL